MLPSPLRYILRERPEHAYEYCGGEYSKQELQVAARDSIARVRGHAVRGKPKWYVAGGIWVVSGPVSILFIESKKRGKGTCDLEVDAESWARPDPLAILDEDEWEGEKTDGDEAQDTVAPSVSELLVQCGARQGEKTANGRAKYRVSGER